MLVGRFQYSRHSADAQDDSNVDHHLAFSKEIEAQCSTSLAVLNHGMQHFRRRVGMEKFL